MGEYEFVWAQRLCECATVNEYDEWIVCVCVKGAWVHCPLMDHDAAKILDNLNLPPSFPFHHLTERLMNYVRSSLTTSMCFSCKLSLRVNNAWTCIIMSWLRYDDFQDSYSRGSRANRIYSRCNLCSLIYNYYRVKVRRILSRCIRAVSILCR